MALVLDPAGQGTDEQVRDGVRKALRRSRTGALGLLTGQMWGIYVPPAFAFRMFMVGVDNAWDLVLSRYGKRSFIDVKTPPPTSSM